MENFPQFTWRSRALGWWGFAPTLIAFMFTVLPMAMSGDNNVQNLFLVNLETTLYAIGFWLLGVGLLMQGQEKRKDDAEKVRLLA